MKTIHFFIDIRRHRGDSNFIIGLINRFLAGQPVLAAEWLVRPDQAGLIPPKSVIGQSEPNDQSWPNGIVIRIRQLSQSAMGGQEFMVLSYDGYLLNSAARLAYTDNLPVKTKHLGTLVKNSWTFLQTPEPVAAVPGVPVLAAGAAWDRRAAPPPSGVSKISPDEAVELMKTVLRRGEYFHRERAIPQKDIRVYMTAMDARAAKAPGDYESETLIRNIVERGQRERWLIRFERTPGKSGTEMLYLEENQATAGTSTYPTELSASEPKGQKLGFSEANNQPNGESQEVIATAPLGAKSEETHEADSRKRIAKGNLPERTALMERAIQDEKIGSLTETRKYFFDAVESILKDKGEETLIVSHLFSRAENVAKNRADEAGYSAEQKWGIAKRCMQRLMIRSGALLAERDGEKVSIFEGFGDESAVVCDLSPDFRMMCTALMAETVIQKLGKLHFKDDYFYLGMALFRRGKMNMVDSESLRIEVDRVLVYLLNKRRIELVGSEIRIAKHSPPGTDRLRVVGT